MYKTYRIRGVQPRDSSALRALYTQVQAGQATACGTAAFTAAIAKGEDIATAEIARTTEARVHEAWCAKVLSSDFLDPPSYYSSTSGRFLLVAEDTLTGYVVGCVAIGEDTGVSSNTTTTTIQPPPPPPPPEPWVLLESARQVKRSRELTRLAVAPSARRGGLASALVNAAEKYAVSIFNAVALCLTTLANFPDALKFYDRIGWSRIVDAKPLQRAFGGAFVSLVGFARAPLPAAKVAIVATSNHAPKIVSALRGGGAWTAITPFSDTDTDGVLDSLQSGDWDLCWLTRNRFKGGVVKLCELVANLPKRSHGGPRLSNRLPNPWPLASKGQLSLTLSGAGGLAFAVLPPTFCFSAAAKSTGAYALETERLLKCAVDLRSDGRAWKADPRSLASPSFSLPVKHTTRDLWIAKPDSAHSGEGVRVCAGVQAALAAVATGMGGGGGGTVSQSGGVTATEWVIQKYIEAPALINGGRKFDIRLLVLIDDKSRVWMYPQGLARAASVPYSTDADAPRASHITNSSVQKHVAGTVDTLSFKGLDSWFKECGNCAGTITAPRPLSVMLDLIPRWRAIAGAVFSAGSNAMLIGGGGTLLSTFELFGLDILLDEDGRSWLLEVNTNPGFDDFGSTDAARLYRRALKGLVTLVVEGGEEGRGGEDEGDDEGGDEGDEGDGGGDGGGLGQLGWEWLRLDPLHDIKIAAEMGDYPTRETLKYIAKTTTTTATSKQSDAPPGFDDL